MHSDRPASEVLASHAALADQPTGEVSNASAYKEIAVPSHLSSVVKLIIIVYIQKITIINFFVLQYIPVSGYSCL